MTQIRLGGRLSRSRRERPGWRSNNRPTRRPGTRRAPSATRDRSSRTCRRTCARARSGHSARAEAFRTCVWPQASYRPHLRFATQMPAAIWTGSLSLGLVVVPVRLYPAIKKKTVRFHELDAAGRRIRHVRVSEPLTEELEPTPSQAWEPRQPFTPAMTSYESPPSPEVAYHEIRKAYEVAPGEYVSMTRQEVAELAPERSRVIDVQQFVDVSAVDAIYFESRYFMVPDREWSCPFRFLRPAMAAAGALA